MTAGVHSLGAGQIAAQLTQAAVGCEAATRRTVRKHTQLLHTRVLAKASGRPGPNAPTGDYRRSWGTGYIDGPGVYSGVVGTNAVQGRRLELGFVGTDSLGRDYDQPPYPHAGPAVQEIEPGFVADLRAIVEAI